MSMLDEAAPTENVKECQRAYSESQTCLLGNACPPFRDNCISKLIGGVNFTTKEASLCS